MHRARTSAVLAVLTLALPAMLSLPGCAPAGGPKDPAVAAVLKALELRRAQAKDVSRYAPLFAESEVATALADAAKASTSTVSPIPEWKSPYVSAQTSSTAEVVVVWVADDAHRGWAPATVFNLTKVSGSWRIADARDVAKGTEPPKALRP